jgi:hypothetical protein
MKKRISKSANMYVMFGLLAVLFVSLGYLSMQSREGFREGSAGMGSSEALAEIAKTLAEGKKPEEKKDEAKKDGFKGKKEGMAKMAGECPTGQTWNMLLNKCDMDK